MRSREGASVAETVIMDGATLSRAGVAAVARGGALVAVAPAGLARAAAPQSQTSPEQKTSSRQDQINVRRFNTLPECFVAQ
jgi:hypothetical protein